MPAIAQLKHAGLSQERIDSEAGVIYGVKLAEKGRVACFAGPDGKPRYATISETFIRALMSHAGNRAIPVHWTHDYKAGEGDPLHAKIGALKNIRLDASGSPIADLHLAPGEHRATALWHAEHDPSGAMLSPVFSYDPKDKESLPQDFQAADLVEVGAATTALFSQLDNQTNQPTNQMTVEELLQMLADPQVKTALKAIIESHEGGDSAPAEMESAAGVTDADKKPEDEQKPAMMRAYLRANRAFKRQLGEAAVSAEAKFTKLIGIPKQSPINGGKAGDEDEVEAALNAYVAAGAKDRAMAIFRLAKDKPALYNAARIAGKL